MDENNLLSGNNYKINLVNEPSEILLQYFNIVKEYLYHAGENIIISDYIMILL